jgi:RNA polymerase sigma-70 factor, ECF subfamily
VVWGTSYPIDAWIRHGVSGETEIFVVDSPPFSSRTYASSRISWIAHGFTADQTTSTYNPAKEIEKSQSKSNILIFDSQNFSHLADVVQETLLDAARKLKDYVRERSLPFYAWLHQLAADRVTTAHRRHLGSELRSVKREEAENPGWSDCSKRMLVDRLVAGDATPGHGLVSDKHRRPVHAALDRLAPTDREVLVMRYLEDLTFPKIAAILGMAEGATKMRHLRALERIRSFMKADNSRSAS